ncbi:protein of unknown function [uncultured Woeseiaceae bacterium]|uniref:Uncharacterized protein n=1 Tax=uncultured Woeseiaceae bacterium TaxID=1983305 RepID=A0A7D9D1Q1_9GAMM|nr:protein of unknown function [uncultured Woeseiaceae bacterium]
MTNSGKILIHALAVHPNGANQIFARATLRIGNPRPGDLVWFEGVDRIKHELEIVEVKRTSRLWTIVLSGAESELEHLIGGTYLYGKEAKG